jgi:hypothetical protein
MERYVERERLGEMDPILLSDTSDEEDMPQKRKEEALRRSATQENCFQMFSRRNKLMADKIFMSEIWKD